MAVATFFIYLTIEVRLVEPKIVDTLNSVQAVETNTVRTEAEASGLLDTVRHIALTEQKATEQQILQAQTIGTQVNQLLSHADTVVTDLDAVSKNASTDEQQLDVVLAQTATSVVEVRQRSDKVLDNAILDLDPKPIQVAEANLTIATDNLAKTSENTAAITAKAKQGVDFEVDQLMKPVQKINTVILFVAQVAGRFF